MRIKSFTFNAFQENTFVLYDDDGIAVIIDPGCYLASERKLLMDFIEAEGLRVEHLLNTHCHIDHVLGNHFVTESFGVPLSIHELELEGLNRVPEYAHVYGFEGYVPSPAPSYFFTDKEKLHLGKLELTVLFTPGHSPGHVVFYLENEGIVINGDVLFDGSFGRTDLPGGDLATLKRSIHEVMFQLPNNTTVYCGHGPSTTIGKEKQSNYILQF